MTNLHLFCVIVDCLHPPQGLPKTRRHAKSQISTVRMCDIRRLGIHMPAAKEKNGQKETVVHRLRRLYYGDNPRARRWRLFLLFLDLTILLYFIVSTLLPPMDWLIAVDLAFGAAILADFSARLTIAPIRWRFVLSLNAVLDILVILSLVLEVLVDNLGFLRVMRTLRLVRSYHVTKALREFSPYYNRHEDVIQSTLNLSVFVFVVTAIVFVVEGARSDQINSYLDALYFTVTTLTTTGFGDITPEGTTGRLLAVVIMVVGVALFLRLVQTVFRPHKVQHACPSCGLLRHDPDAVHCKHCGEPIAIPTEGDWS